MVTSQREKTLLVITITLILLLPVYFWLKLMWDRWHELDVKAQLLTQKLEGRRELIGKRAKFQERWKNIEGRVERAKEEDAESRFRTHLWKLAENEAGISFDELRPRRQEEKDYTIVTFSAEFKCKLDQLTRFLYALDQADNKCLACLMEQKQKSRRSRGSSKHRTVKNDDKETGDSPSHPNGTKESTISTEQLNHTCQLLKVTRLSIRSSSRSNLLSVDMDIATMLPVVKKTRRTSRRGRRTRS